MKFFQFIIFYLIRLSLQTDEFKVNPEDFRSIARREHIPALPVPLTLDQRDIFFYSIVQITTTKLKQQSISEVRTSFPCLDYEWWHLWQNFIFHSQILRQATRRTTDRNSNKRTTLTKFSRCSRAIFPSFSFNL